MLLSRSVADWACEDRVLRQFLHKAQGLYHDNPYHSAVHGSMVRSDYSYRGVPRMLACPQTQVAVSDQTSGGSLRLGAPAENWSGRRGV